MGSSISAELNSVIRKGSPFPQEWRERKTMMKLREKSKGGAECDHISTLRGENSINSS